MRNTIPVNMKELSEEFHRAHEQGAKITIFLKRPSLPSWEEIGVPTENILPCLDMLEAAFTEYPTGIQHTGPRICLKPDPQVFIASLGIDEPKDGLACMAPPKEIENVVCVCCGDNFTTDVVMDNGVCVYCDAEYIRQMRAKAVAEYFKEELK